jgi:transposase
MTNPADRVEIMASGQRRRRWTASEKVRIVEETVVPGMTVSLLPAGMACAEQAVHLA